MFVASLLFPLRLLKFGPHPIFYEITGPKCSKKGHLQIYESKQNFDEKAKRGERVRTESMVLKSIVKTSGLKIRSNFQVLTEFSIEN